MAAPRLRWIALLAALAWTLTACGLVVSFSDYELSVGRFAVSGSVEGVESGTVLMVVNGTAAPAGFGNGPFSVPAAVDDGKSFTIEARPPSGHSCTVTNGAGTIKGRDATDVRVVCASTDATLADLVVSAGPILPGFRGDVLAYGVGPVVTPFVDGLKTTTTVTATSRSPGARIEIAGATVASGAASAPIALRPGANPIVVKVHAKDPAVPAKTYTVVVEGTASDYLKASNTRAQTYFGYAVAMSGDTLVVGSYGERSGLAGVNPPEGDTSMPGAGAAYVFRRTAAGWAQEAYLKASNPRANAYFGTSVAISGDTIAVGSDDPSAATGVDGNQGDTSLAGAGAVYVFTRAGTTWTQQAYVKASNTRAGAHFGEAVTLAGDTLAVASKNESSNAKGIGQDQANTSAPNAGAVYVFARSGSTWSQEAYIKASNARSDAFFGESVSLSGSTLVVGASGDRSKATGVGGDELDTSVIGAGAAYVFIRNAGTWSQQAYLKPAKAVAQTSFGSRVGLDGDTLAVWATGDSTTGKGIDPVTSPTDKGAADSGAVYVFSRSGATWSQQAYIKPSNTHPNEQFGYSLAVSGDQLAVGALGEASASTNVDGDETTLSALNAGAVFLYRRTGGVWAKQAYLKAPRARAGAGFGSGVALTGGRLAVSAQGETSGATGINGDQSDTSADRAGAAYVFF